MFRELKYRVFFEKEIYLILILIFFGMSEQVNAQNFLWGKQIGSLNYINGVSVIDASGNIYTTGSFSDTIDFDPGPGIYNLITNNPSNTNSYVSKLDASGNFVWAKQFVSAGSINCTSLALDINGNIFTTGVFGGTVDFDPGPGTYNLSSAANYTNSFVTKLDASGNFVWAKQAEGESRSVGVDAVGNIYTAGMFAGTIDLDPGPGTYNLTNYSTNLSISDIYISKLDASGNFVWAKQLGGASDDYFFSMAIDASGNVFTTGSFFGTADFDPGPANYSLTTISSSEDIFISKLDASGNFAWAKRFGGMYPDRCYSIKVDGSGNVYATGYSWATNIVKDQATIILKLDASGNVIWTKQMVAADNPHFYGNEGWATAIDASGNVYTTGQLTAAADFDPGPGTYFLTSPSFVGPFGNVYFHSSVFISKLDALGNFAGAQQIDGTAGVWNRSLNIDASGNLVITGGFDSTADFDPGAGIYNMTSSGLADIFILKLGTVVTGIMEFNSPVHSLTIFPNPLSSFTTISFSLAKPIRLSLSIVDAQGKLVFTLAENFYNKGDHRMVWKAADIKSGIYFLSIKSGGLIQTRKLVVIK
jgi:hypothetical protein